MPKMITWAEAERLIRTAEHAFSQADIPAILDLFGSDVVARYAGLPEIHGRDALRELLEGRFERQREYRVRKTLRMVADDLIGDSWSGEWIDAQTNQRMVGEGMEFLRIRDGKVVELDAVFHGWPAADAKANIQIA